MHIGIVNPICPKPYDAASFIDGGLGGTEATILRVFGHLSTQHAVSHFQVHRTTSAHLGNQYFEPLAQWRNSSSLDVLIVIGSWETALSARRIDPQIPILLWLHNFANRHNRSMGNLMRDANIKIVCVSKTHATATERLLATRGSNQPDIVHMYNAVDDTLIPNDTIRDPNRLLFASSPNKGLPEVLVKFAKLNKLLPDLRLRVANPGYFPDHQENIPPNVEFLGTLSHSEVIAEMRRSLCLFCPQTTFAETFGLVIAEANAVGTPVICHAGFGANDEVVSSPEQSIDTNDPNLILREIKRLRQTNPDIVGKSEFRLSIVAELWNEFLQTITHQR